ncbi:sulfoxide reductase heme-binding subunit YedZ [Starkeya sp. ORNL1]|uniref:sulfite oxidase heme-binding subunit YedZ n=1 Tax=Starkeya sp. ORNL1 TaxID=2709380 RepID=UPI00146456B8|nr:protein-methionine-sulfoxide reductase heme-binding subunit MsrQ [Starkeya sp. ORNL1]QJP16428.1 sulfoxide reductase heme-binding subunit YedZ [Starkeya sp. ORNL1]
MPFLRERNGKLSPEKIIAFIGVLLPLGWLLWRALGGEFAGAFSGPPSLGGPGLGAPGLGGPGLGGPGLGGGGLGGGGLGGGGLGDGPALGARPIVEVIRYIGEWTIRLLLITLAVTPARRLFNWPKLLSARRTLGVAAMSYVLIHFGLYIIDLNGDLAMVAREIVLRIYLTIGFIALVGLVALGSTSWDGAVQRLGSERWNQLHMLAYPITALGILHFFMQQKLDVTEPTLMAGMFVWLMGWRIAQRFNRGTDSLALVVLALASGVLTALLEAGWYLAATGVDPKLVLEANLAFDYSIRPAWWIAGLGLAIALASRLALQVRPLPARRPARA